ncbi:peptide/nickel transport system permease protein [Kitasatospora sp. MAP12-15]|uniref:ABC transporter permease n=1 Tax=unclassified Kitasatospora TaxID=2633591 RepID=UPI002474821F|nr:ABC transporter permease [Kitasatospora sp. MAP12-44]MDH6115209.1 peptide/nickel transport system permease protein [Kitasatospora sp. MAP12-44]
MKETLLKAARRLGRSGTASAVLLLVVLVVAIAAPLLAPHDPNQGSLLDAYSGPSGAHPLGADGIGRDILSRLVFGARTSLLGPALVVVVSLLVGIPLALAASWYGGWVDAVVARVFDLVYALPGLLLAVLTVALFGPGLTPAVAALSVAYVPFLARIVRAAARQQRVSPYVDALAVQGFGVLRITVRHILRNIAPVVVGQATIAFGYALLDLASLSYLGLAVQAPTPDWGVMVSDSDALLKGYWLPVAAPGVLIVLTVLALTVLGARISGDKPPGYLKRRKRAAAPADSASTDRTAVGAAA